MALSNKARRRLEVSMAHRADAKEVADAIDAGANAAAAVVDIATANASDAATTQAMANECKAKINALLASLRAAGILATE